MANKTKNKTWKIMRLSCGEAPHHLQFVENISTSNVVLVYNSVAGVPNSLSAVGHIYILDFIRARLY